MKGTEKSPITVLLLTIITCGIYGLVWMYSSRNELKNYLNDQSINSGLDLFLAIICFPFAYVWYYKMGKDIARAQAQAGLPVNDQSVLLLILTFFGLGIVSIYIIQDNLNAIWRK